MQRFVADRQSSCLRFNSLLCRRPHWVAYGDKMYNLLKKYNCNTNGRVGNLAHLVKVNRHILMPKNAVYLFLVAQTTNPNLAAIPKRYKTIMHIRLVVLSPYSFIQPW